MAYKHTDKSAGQPVPSADWNSMGHAIEDLANSKVDRVGDIIKGDLNVTGKITAPVAQFSSSLAVTGPVTVSGMINQGRSLAVGNLDSAGYIKGASLAVTGELST